MREEDRRYYTRRVREERDRGSKCDDYGIAEIHFRMADIYEQRLREAPVIESLAIIAKA